MVNDVSFWTLAICFSDMFLNSAQTQPSGFRKELVCGRGSKVSHWEQSLLSASPISTLHLNVTNRTSVLLRAAMYPKIFRPFAAEDDNMSQDRPIKSKWKSLDRACQTFFPVKKKKSARSACIFLLLSALPHSCVILGSKVEWPSCDLGEKVYILKMIEERAKRILDFSLHLPVVCLLLDFFIMWIKQPSD